MADTEILYDGRGKECGIHLYQPPLLTDYMTKAQGGKDAVPDTTHEYLIQSRGKMKAQVC